MTDRGKMTSRADDRQGRASRAAEAALHRLRARDGEGRAVRAGARGAAPVPRAGGRGALLARPGRAAPRPSSDLTSSSSASSCSPWASSRGCARLLALLLLGLLALLAFDVSVADDCAAATGQRRRSRRRTRRPRCPDGRRSGVQAGVPRSARGLPARSSGPSREPGCRRRSSPSPRRGGSRRRLTNPGAAVVAKSLQSVRSPGVPVAGPREKVLVQVDMLNGGDTSAEDARIEQEASVLDIERAAGRVLRGSRRSG